MKISAENTRIFNEINVLYLEGKSYIHCGFPDFLEQFGCKVTSVYNEVDLLKYYHETQVNAFNIFDSKKYHLIIFDVFSNINNSFTALRLLRESYSELPALVALATPEQSLLHNKFKENGFDYILDYPLPAEDFLLKMNSCLEIPASVINEPCNKISEEKVENYPVLSLKTYSSILAQAGKNGFTLLPLYKTFLMELETHMKQFISAFENQDRINYEATLSAIRGLCVTMGASQVYQVANRIETFARNGNSDEVGNLLPFLIEKFLILQEFISQWQKKQIIIAA